jgi:hypothetical protein
MEERLNCGRKGEKRNGGERLIHGGTRHRKRRERSGSGGIGRMLRMRGSSGKQITEA